MSDSLVLTDPLAVPDLQVYLARAARVEDGAVRLVAEGGVLAVYTAVVYPRGLLDTSPTVLGLRTWRTPPDLEVDVVVPNRSLRERVAHVVAGETPPGERVTVGIPLQVASATWAGITPPRGGWREVVEADSEVFRAAAREGMREVSDAVPAGTGEQLVARVRADVWSSPVPEIDWIPAGAAFAAESLGFLSDDAVTVFESGTWVRLTTRRGHVLVKRQSWSLAG